MTNPNDGAHKFVGSAYIDPGLTKREWFAGLAMATQANELCAQPLTYERMAFKAVRMADSLIAELNKTEK